MPQSRAASPSYFVLLFLLPECILGVDILGKTRKKSKDVVKAELVRGQLGPLTSNTVVVTLLMLVRELEQSSLLEGFIWGTGGRSWWQSVDSISGSND